MHIYLYKITNKINNKYYIGIHKTRYKEDAYMGSGKIIKQAIKKYGENNFVKEILEYFDTWEQALARERELVTVEFVDSPETYNIKIGGNGGWDFINKHGLNQSSEARKKKVQTLKEGYASGSIKPPTFLGKNHSPETKKIIGEKRKEIIETKGHNKGMLGKKHTDEHKQKMSKYFIENAFFKGVTGDNHPAGNTTWYNDGTKNFRVKKDAPVNDSWTIGRITKSYKTAASKRLNKILNALENHE